MSTTPSVMALVRADLQAFAGYSSARSSALVGDVWLNANEAAWANPADSEGRARRYPEPQPAALRARLAQLYGCSPDQLLIGRGSDEAIDLLVRTLCTPGRDAVLVTPPVFGMYAVCARLQNAPLLEVPLRDDGEALNADIDAVIAAALAGNAKLVFLCSPSNPAGSTVTLAQVERVASALQGRALVVVDEAYAEYSALPSAVTLLERFDNVAVLRTLSKAHALAAARIGSLIAAPALIQLLRRCQAPYPVPGPCAELALAGLSDSTLQLTASRVERIKAERSRLQQALALLPGVRQVYPSQGNYLLVRFNDAQQAFDALLGAGVVVRDQRAAPQLHNALRITIGSTLENDRMLSALTARRNAA